MAPPKLQITRKRLQRGFTKGGRVSWTYKRITSNTRIILQTNATTPITNAVDNSQMVTDDDYDSGLFLNTNAFHSSQRALGWKEKMERLHQEWEAIHAEQMELLIMREFEKWEPRLVECEHEKVDLKVYAVGLLGKLILISFYFGSYN